MSGPASEFVDAVLAARSRELGGLSIRRLLPSKARQRIGPFIFFDHIGPTVLAPSRGIDVAPHPHIGLATVTYLFEGDLIHRDSLGIVETIRPGEINWMHAGRGIVHSERSGPVQRKQESRLHGIQLWVALPHEQEETAPEFRHYPREVLPTWVEPGIAARVLVGNAFDTSSPVSTASSTLYVDIAMESGRRLLVPPASERGIYLVEGRVVLGSDTFGSGDLIVLKSRRDVVVEADEATRLIILGGDRLAGERHIWWNFVSSSKERIDRAKQDWIEGRFPFVPGDEKERAEAPS